VGKDYLATIKLQATEKKLKHKINYLGHFQTKAEMEKFSMIRSLPLDHSLNYRVPDEVPGNAP
jgi:hypothetical protein